MARSTAYVGIGSNLEHPRRQVARAVRALRRLPGSRLLRVSGNYVSAALGSEEPQPEYINAVAQLSTRLRPAALLARLHAIERRQHRRRDSETKRNAARTLDLDLLLYGRRRSALARLALPHPRMHERAFVLRPLRDIAATVTIPGRGLARGFLRNVRGQRIVPTRTHRIR